MRSARDHPAHCFELYSTVTTKPLQDPPLLQRHDVPFNGGHEAWRGRGSGPPLVLLHGGHGSWAHWARNIDALALHFTVWAPDLPVYGDSTPPLAPTLDALLDALHETADARPASMSSPPPGTGCSLRPPTR